MYVDDCVEGIHRLMRSDFGAPLNLGTDELVTINQLVDMTAQVAHKRILRKHDLTKPQGVRGRNSDNTRLRAVLGWEPQISLCEGLALTYPWIESQLKCAGRIP
jgi:nucleoside-diphosphate-sugar epimerase